MPDVSRLSTEHRKALLGCVKGKATKWQGEHPGEEMPGDVNQKHFTECSQALGMEKVAAPSPEQARKVALQHCVDTKNNEWSKRHLNEFMVNNGEVPSKVVAKHRLDCQAELKKTIRPSEAVRAAAWGEADLDLRGGKPVTMADVAYVYEMTKRGVPEYGGQAALRWSRRALRAAGMVKVDSSGDLQLPGFVDMYLGPQVLAELHPESVEGLTPTLSQEAVLLPVDEGTLVLTAAAGGEATTPGELVLDDVSWDAATVVGPGAYKMYMIHKAAGKGTAGYNCRAVGDDAWLLSARDAGEPVWKVDEELGLVFGWGIISAINGVPYYDTQGDNITDPCLLKGAMEFMELFRDMSDMHQAEDEAEVDEYGRAPIRKGTVVFCWPLTAEVKKAFGIVCDKTGLLVAVKPDPDVLEKFRNGTYTGFSIGGRRIPAFTEEV